MSEGSFVIGAQAQAQSGIVLNLNPDTTGGIVSFIVPEGTHKFQISNPPEVDYTSDGEAMIVLKCRVAESNVSDALGTNHTERLIIPGDERKANDPAKWNTMMKFLRLKLEAITGKTWREDNLELKPNELTGCYFIATVTHEKKLVPQDDGTAKEYSNPRLNNWQAIQNTAQQQMPGVTNTVASSFGAGIGNVNTSPDPTAGIEPF